MHKVKNQLFRTLRSEEATILRILFPTILKYTPKLSEFVFLGDFSKKQIMEIQFEIAC